MARTIINKTGKNLKVKPKKKKKMERINMKGKALVKKVSKKKLI